MGANDTGVIGQSVKRKEDARFLLGTGQFTDDVIQPNQVHAIFLRSPPKASGSCRCVAASMQDASRSSRLGERPRFM